MQLGGVMDDNCPKMARFKSKFSDTASMTISVDLNEFKVSVYSMLPVTYARLLNHDPSAPPTLKHFFSPSPQSHCMNQRCIVREC
jgi:hypothetical protein